MKSCPSCGTDLTGTHGKRVWCSERCRRTQYAGSCEDCGAPTNGHNGPGKAGKRCLSCERHRNDERNGRILEAWEAGLSAPEIAAREGVPPTTVAGVVDHRRRRKGERVSLHRRVNRELWPLIERRWNEGVSVPDIAAEADTTADNVYFMAGAMRRAGFELSSRDTRVDVDPAAVAAKYRAGWSCARIAETEGCSPATVWRRLVEAGVPRRSPGRSKAAA